MIQSRRTILQVGIEQRIFRPPEAESYDAKSRCSAPNQRIIECRSVTVSPPVRGKTIQKMQGHLDKPHRESPRGRLRLG